MKNRMTLQQKLNLIQKMTGLTQTKLAEKLGVSFVAFNGWWTGKVKPRQKALAAIDELFLQVTGGKTIPQEQLQAKKQALAKITVKHKNVLTEIMKNPDIHDEFILKLTYHSNKIEGSTLSEPETAAILFDNAALPNKSLTEQLEAKNHQTAINFLLTYLAGDEDITEELILRLHGILMNGVRPDAGQYRRHAVRIMGVNLPTTNYLRIPDFVPPLIRAVNGKNTDIIHLAATTHAQFEQIHPFSDGNGRIGRLLLIAMLLKANLAPAIIRQNVKQLYYTYLHKAQTKGDASQLEDFICDAVADGFRILQRSYE